MKKQTEKEQLKQRIKDLEDQNRFLRNENERLLKKNERLRIKEERRILAGELGGLLGLKWLAGSMFSLMYC